MSVNELNKFLVSLDASEESADDFSFLSNIKQVPDLDGHSEGQLSVDVSETQSEIIIVAPMAGAPKDHVELHLHNDLLTIRGQRISPTPPGAHIHYKECYFGKFSRSIVLPAEINPNMAKAEYKNGLLVIRLPKIKIDQGIPIFVVEE